jgi:hypothetical protein
MESRISEPVFSKSAPFDTNSKYANSTGLDFEMDERILKKSEVNSKKIRSIQDPIHGVIVLEDPI